MRLPCQRLLLVAAASVAAAAAVSACSEGKSNSGSADVQKQMGEFTFSDFSAMESKARSRAIYSDGCTFTADIKGEKLSYQATPRLTSSTKRALDVSVYVLEKNGALRLLGDTILEEQLKSDAGAGIKFASDSNLGSLAIWIDPTQPGEILSAKIAHKLPSGEFLGNLGQIEGTCKL